MNALLKPTEKISSEKQVQIVWLDWWSMRMNTSWFESYGTLIFMLVMMFADYLDDWAEAKYWRSKNIFKTCVSYFDRLGYYISIIAYHRYILPGTPPCLRNRPGSKFIKFIFSSLDSIDKPVQFFLFIFAFFSWPVLTFHSLINNANFTNVDRLLHVGALLSILVFFFFKYILTEQFLWYYD